MLENELKFHHLGYAVADVKKGRDSFCHLFESQIKQVGEIVLDPHQNAELCLIQLKDQTFIELVAGPIVNNYLKKQISLYHVCYEVRDLEKQIENFVKKGCLLVVPPKPAILFQRRRVCFLLNNFGLMELLEAV